MTKITRKFLPLVGVLLLAALVIAPRLRHAALIKAHNRPDPEVTGAWLAAAQRADRAEVIGGSMYESFNRGNGRHEGDMLLKLTGPKVAEFARTFEFRQLDPDENVTSCLCEGEFDVQFFKGKKAIARVFVMEDGDIRSRDGLWRYDRPLTERAKAKIAAFLSPFQHRPTK